MKQLYRQPYKNLQIKLPQAASVVHLSLTQPGSEFIFAPMTAIKKCSASDFFSEKALFALKTEISKWGGREVFFGGNTGRENKTVTSVNVLGRGHETAAPVIFEEAKHYDVLIHNHPSGYLVPSDADLNIAAALGDYSCAFYIISNDAGSVSVVTPVHKKKRLSLNPDEITEMFKEGNAVSKIFSNYQKRTSQVMMTEGVIKAFNDNKIFLCEAATGTGKSLAYLLPALYWIKKNETKLVVSTNTISLQEQIMTKDLPSILKMDGLDGLTFTIVKGRSNYLCRHRFNRRKLKTDQTLLTKEEDKLLTKETNEIFQWAKETEDGDKTNLGFSPKTQSWSLVCSESDTCRKQACAFFHDCFYRTARKKYFSADILIVNHHILCADLEIKKEKGNFNDASLLPAYKKLIIDETHNLEETASGWFSISASVNSFKKNLTLISGHDSRKQPGGKISEVLSELKKHMDHSVLLNKTAEAAVTFHRLRKKFQKETDMFLSHIKRFMGEEGNGEIKKRITKKVLTEELFQKSYKAPTEKYVDYLCGLNRCLNKITGYLSEVSDYPEEESDELTQLTRELNAYKERFARSLSCFENSFEPAAEGYVNWFSFSQSHKKNIQFKIFFTPLSVAESLEKTVYRNCETVIMTSATIADHKGFGYYRKRNGIDMVAPERVIQKRLPHNFNYSRQCSVFIPSSIPSVNAPDFIPCTAPYIISSAQIFKGSTMVLCTSYGQIRGLKSILSKPLEETGIELLCQSDLPRSDLIHRFQTQRRSVLVGVNSFWEGLDLPGDALKSVFIIKLPFSVPNEPVTEARSEAVQKEGLNPFTNYTLPLAVIRFKQGFGRLIRKNDDSGVFTVLDDRVIKKPYGRSFQNVLPRMPFVSSQDFSDAVQILNENRKTDF